MGISRERARELVAVAIRQEQRHVDGPIGELSVRTKRSGGGTMSMNILRHAHVPE
jgi:hypothetical protein